MKGILYLLEHVDAKLNAAVAKLVMRHYNQRSEIRAVVTKTKLLKSPGELSMFEQVKGYLAEIDKAIATISVNTHRQNILCQLLPKLGALCSRNGLKRFMYCIYFQGYSTSSSQDFLCHLGVADRVMKILQAPFNSSLTELFSACYDFLQQV